MSVFAHHPPRPTGIRSHGARQSLRNVLVGIVRRLADSPLEQPVLHALDAPVRRVTVGAVRQRPYAHWQMTASPDGVRRLEAIWHTRH
ncbi:hypothetical protein AB0L75_14120 [Streptomyces sp. NPDC052101]|uniref:hypothetical protein n=1 Tax=Streptomyces sp. NPDC052101 TaxID=3155763 RepID=UPI0034318689